MRPRAAAYAGWMRTLLGLGFLALLAVGCGGSGAVGSHCGSDGDCDSGQHLSCNTGLPQGYCTIACATPGQIGTCPGNSICATVNSLPMCVHICNSLVDCRPNYGCNSLGAGTTTKGCTP